MSPAAAFHSQLASIMEVLANTAVAEICELVDSGYSVLQLEISRSRKENEVLRRKLRLMELRAARTAALRAAATAGGGGGGSGSGSGGGSAMLLAGGRSRAHLSAHPGNEPRRNGTPRGQAALSRVSNQETLPCGDAGLSSDPGQDHTQGTPAGGESTKLTAAVIKVEDDDDSWSQTEQDKEFCLVIDGQTTKTEAPPPPNKQEVVEESGDLTRSWVSEEVSSTSSSVQKTLNTSHRSESSGYSHLMYEPQLQHGSASTQNPLGEDPSCSYALNTSVSVSAASESGCSIFPFTVCEVTQSAAEHQQPAGFQESQERAPLPVDEPQLPVRKEMSVRQSSFVRRDRWRHQDGVNTASCPTGVDGGGFVCNYCSKTLACLKNLKTHMRVHTGEKPFVCTLCGKRFSDSSNLKRHQSVHTGEKRYGCIHCGKRFAQSGSLKVHMTVHTDCKQFRCSYCGKTFISASHLRRHVTVHYGEKQPTQTPQ